MPKTLQLLEISRFQFNFHHDYTGDLFNFRLNFRFNFHRAAPPGERRQSEGEAGRGAEVPRPARARAGPPRTRAPVGGEVGREHDACRDREPHVAAYVYSNSKLERIFFNF